ncbi:D-alanyl-D-alanine carboxypeptidase DacB precursor [Pirellulimonas nuda]|uniref:beta-lactamase n=1 Tax=Pirellulimonas nuda TaxID=2528009 RepID=A0A518DAL2_9BACT|nr:serine hydrolase [Pirellulimonas nuda]QDU88493.1 D-alanyl-D-alanine carboxypeptidase DacB precursor [Pirellulimonas nuda]
MPHRPPASPRFLLCLLALACARPGDAAEPAAEAPSAAQHDALQDAVAQLIKLHRGVVGAAAKQLDTGESFAWNADQPMPTASLIKLPIMLTAYRQIDAGELSPDATIELRKQDKVPGSGVLSEHMSAGARFSLRDAIELMIVFSDNTATNLVIEKTGLPATSALMRKLGYPETQLHSKVFLRETTIDPERSQKYGLGSTTAADMIRLLESLYKGDAASSESCEAMLGHLRRCDDRSKVPRYLPEEVEVAHKTGSVSATRCDAGIIESKGGPLAFCILTTDNADRGWGAENEAELLAAAFGKTLYDHFNEPEETPAVPPARVLAVGSDGLLVEALQRTLNARTEPSLGIGVDGDFGPNTESGVKAFQKQEGLEVTGRVDAATWRALGPLITEDAPEAPPEVVNAESLSTKPADRLGGPPLVASAAYAIADAANGELLWGMNDSEARDPASVTKIMTAHLVLKLAESDPEVLDEEIVFSTVADETPGSTSGVRAGETVTVRELLYGLMLPSGNDASVAFAEHFGARVDPDPKQDGGPYEGFIRAMNAEAKRLGMKETGYRNTSGLTAKGHVTSARDMARLAHAAMKSPVLREVVATRQHGATLGSLSGYQRNVVWTNTNRLLGIDGFTGVKTGTTPGAGACLVASGEREGRGLIVVVLGAPSSDSRYIDSRNLFRWAWRQLARGSGETGDQ